MDIIWYPGSGADFRPALTLVTSTPRPECVPAPDAGAPTLWMTDYCPEIAREFDALRIGASLGDGVVIRDFRRFRLDEDEAAQLDHQEAEWARRASGQRWAENGGDGQLQPVPWDVTGLVLEPADSASAAAGMGSWRVWFSPFESEAAIEHIFGPLRVRLHTVVLLRLGGSSGQRTGRYHLDHHGPRFFALLHEHGTATGSGLPEFVLADRDTPGWARTEPYEITDAPFQGCVEPGVRLFRKRAGEIENPPSSRYEQNPRSEHFRRSMREPWARAES